jgi:hypothetical protein
MGLKKFIADLAGRYRKLTESSPNSCAIDTSCGRRCSICSCSRSRARCRGVRGRPKSGIRSWPSWGAFVRVEGFRVEFDRVAEQPPFSKSLRTNIRLRSGNFPATVLILHLAESLCNFIATRGARQSLSENSRPSHADSVEPHDSDGVTCTGALRRGSNELVTAGRNRSHIARRRVEIHGRTNCERDSRCLRQLPHATKRDFHGQCLLRVPPTRIGSPE